MNRAIDITFKDRDRILKLIEKEKEFGTEKIKAI